MRRSGTLFLIVGLLSSRSLLAQTATSDQARIYGYGDIVFSMADYGEDPKGSTKGSKSDRRTVLDAKRFIIELEKKLTRGFKFEAEVEIEHGGTGAALELEYEESGEYEVEAEKGGEVQLEELFLEHNSEDRRIRVGRIPVAFGLLPLYHHPFDYLGTIRAESEEHLIPSGWSEIGAEYLTQGAKQMLQVQLVNGLDSTGFSSQFFVRGGQQTKFETVKANNPAAVLRWTNYNIPGLEAGLSYYYSQSTSANRPQPDLIKTCKGTADKERVAPCGYVETPLQMASLFARGQWGALQSQTSLVWGQIKNADDINRRNQGLPKGFSGVLRTPIAEQAFSAWTEWGYAFDGFEDGDSLIPFFRLENFDTVWKTAPGQLNQPRFDRRVLALGVNYQIESMLYFKVDVMERRFGSADLRPEHELRFAMGFNY